ncbi:hypothetical protein BKA65DRAFT_514318 [Rhexocercosporidium sp. MPI-PUGE-AT-0058]|nr:hypothetical protein BKA65DRAFT_514318 [Rhexocercosporidium sp. MPI-PUGE-AT-0058]
MSDPPSYDQHLLDRLNALRKSSVEFDPSKPKPISPAVTTPETDLSARLRSLRNGPLSSSPSPSPVSKLQQSKPATSPDPVFPSAPAEDPDPLRDPFNTDNKTLDELLADLGPEDQWTLNPDDPKDIQKLLDEAKGALPRDGEAKVESKDLDHEDDSEGKARRPDRQYLTRDLDMSAFALDDGEPEDRGKGKGRMDLEQESREAQDIVARILDEVNLERATEPKEKEESSTSSERLKESASEESSGLFLPSAPSALPEPVETSKKSLDFESDIAARMSALSGLSTNSLGLPSAPTFKPIDKPIKGVMKKFPDEEVDSWCIICQDDATVKCMGCDGDLYCANCWKEGHMGPDVGYEEKTHKWVKYRKPN